MLLHDAAFGIVNLVRQIEAWSFLVCTKTFHYVPHWVRKTFTGNWF